MSIPPTRSLNDTEASGLLARAMEEALSPHNIDPEDREVDLLSSWDLLEDEDPPIRRSIDLTNHKVALDLLVNLIPSIDPEAEIFEPVRSSRKPKEGSALSSPTFTILTVLTKDAVERNVQQALATKDLANTFFVTVSENTEDGFVDGSTEKVDLTIKFDRV